MNISLNIKTSWRIPALAAVLFVHGCGSSSTPSDSANTASATGTNTNTNTSTSTSGTSDAAATPMPKELAKPAAGKGNVQGRVLFNDKPAANIEVTLNEKFSPFMGASGKSYTARTNSGGDYVIKNVPPKEYGGLTARVFDTNTVVFIKSSVVDSKKYVVEAGKTLFVDPTNLFKSDLKILSPKAASTIAGNQAVIKWQSYPDATYYNVSLYPDDIKNTSGVFDQRSDAPSYQPTKPLPPGGYRIDVEAYNGNDHKISECPPHYEFRIAP